MGSFNANATDVWEVSQLTLRVLPNYASKVQINTSLDQIKQDYILLGIDINQVKLDVDGNTVPVDTLYAAVGGNITATQNQITNNDYFSAYQSLAILKDQLNKTRTELVIVNQTGRPPIELPSITNWLIIGSAFVGFVIIVYMIWPTKIPYAPGVRKKSFGPPQKRENILKGVKEKIFGRKKTRTKEVRIVVPSQGKAKSPSK